MQQVRLPSQQPVLCILLSGSGSLPRPKLSPLPHFPFGAEVRRCGRANSGWTTEGLPWGKWRHEKLYTTVNRPTLHPELLSISYTGQARGH